MLKQEVLKFLKAQNSPLWIEKEQIGCVFLFLSEILSTQEEKDFMKRVANSLELGTEVQIISKHWTEEELKNEILAKKPRFVIGFGDELEALFSKWSAVPKRTGALAWNSISIEAHSFQFLSCSSPFHLKKNAEEKKSLWNALKTAKAQFGRPRLFD